MTSIQKLKYNQVLYKWDSEVFESVFTLLICVLSYRNCHLCRRIMVAVYSCLMIGIVFGC